MIKFNYLSMFKMSPLERCQEMKEGKTLQISNHKQNNNQNSNTTSTNKSWNEFIQIKK